ncbi:MAG: NTP transferase domain-containing protein, partial [Halobacteriales archaeon]|nr:NTP transferase domain-containing protein [Halobacteriales archaeon]
MDEESGTAPWAGVVLAGGGSTRFGEADKLLAELDGTPLVRRVVDRLAARTDRLVVAV